MVNLYYSVGLEIEALFANLDKLYQPQGMRWLTLLSSQLDQA